MLLEPACMCTPAQSLHQLRSPHLFPLSSTCTQPGRKMLWHFVQKWLIFIHKHVLVLNYKRENSKWACHVGCFVLALPYLVYAVYTGAQRHDPPASMSTSLHCLHGELRGTGPCCLHEHLSVGEEILPERSEIRISTSCPRSTRVIF